MTKREEFKVRYHGGMGPWDGCTDGEVYRAVDHATDQERYLILVNDYGAQSSLLKSKFDLVEE